MFAKISEFTKAHLLEIGIIAISLVVHFAISSRFVLFNQDQARDLYIVENAIQNHDYVFAYGPKASVWDFYLPPFYYQLHLVVSIIFGQAPMAMKYFITFVESFTPLILFMILKKFLDNKKSMILSLLYLLSGTALFASVHAWNPTMIPFFSTLTLYLWLRVIVNNDKLAIAWAILSSSLAMQLHYQSVILIPFAVIVFGLQMFARKLDLRPWTIGILLSLLFMAPYFFQEMNSNWHNTSSIVTYFTSEHSHYFDRVSKIDYVTKFVPGHISNLLVGKSAYWLGQLVLVLATIAIVIGRKKSTYQLWVFVYIVLLVLSLRFYKGDKLDYYLYTLYVAPYPLIGIIWQRLKSFYWGILLVPMLILSWQGLMAKTPVNDYLDLAQAVNTIQPEIGKNTFTPVFYNDDDINKYYYMLDKKFPGQIVKDGEYVLEIGNSSRGSYLTVVSKSKSVTEYPQIQKNNSGYGNDSIFPY